MQMACELQALASRLLIIGMLCRYGLAVTGRMLCMFIGALLSALLFATPAPAQSCSAYTYTLTNGTTADATQVMSNFNAIMSCVNSNLAHNGANSDITSLSAASSINGLTISPSTGTLSIANGKAASFSNTLTLAGTDSTTITFPSTSATIARTDASNTFTGANLGANGNGWKLVDSAASATVPTLIPNQSSSTTGWGAQASGNISGIIAGAEEFRLTSSGINNAPIGQTTPAAGTFTSLQNTSISGSTQCVHADSSGNLTGSGADCPTAASPIPLPAWRFVIPTTSSFTNSFAAHGDVFTPTQAINVYSVTALITTVTSATYKVCAGLYNTGTNKLSATPICSGIYTVATGHASEEVAGNLSSPLAVPAGSAFTVYFVRTDSTSTVSTTVNNTSTAPAAQNQPGFFTQANPISFCTDLASVNPGTGDTWTASTSCWHSIDFLYSLQ